MPLLGLATANELSDKVSVTTCSQTAPVKKMNVANYLQALHPFFNRYSISEYTKWYAEGVYLASHYWTKIVSG